MKVVAIHGIGHRFEGSETIREAWLPALNSGLQEAGYALLDSPDFLPIFFGSIFRPPGKRGFDVTLSADEERWAQELLVEFNREAARLSEQNRGDSDPTGEDPRIQAPDADSLSRSRAPNSMQAILRQLSKSRFFKALAPERLLLADLAEVRRFLHEAAIKAAVLERCEKDIKPGARVVIGHSLGSVVAYEALCRHPEWRVDTFISLGSPLGIRHLVFDALTPAPHNGRGIRPEIRRWVNIADAGDIVALEKDLAKYFDGIEDVRVYNGWASHDARRYLTARETGNIVGEALAR
jgi:hypothetical protein